MIDPDRVNTKDLAAILGVTRQTILQRKKDNIFKEITRGKYNLRDAVHAYIKYINHGHQTGKTATTKRQVDEERARKLKLENDKTEKLLLEAGDVREVFANTLVILRQHIAALPDRLAPAVTGKEDQAEVYETIDKEVRQALATCGDKLESFGSLEGIVPADKASRKKNTRSVGRRK